MIDTLKQAKIDSLNTKIEKCKQSIARFNELVTKHHYSKVDKLEIMEFKCYKDRYSYFDFKHPDTHIGIDVVKYLSQYEELRIFCDAHAHIDNANKEIKSLNVMLVT